MLEKPKLFENYREFGVIVFLFLLLFGLRLGWLYGEYREFVQKPFYFTKATVLQEYRKTKGGKPYWIFRLYSESLDLTFMSRLYTSESSLMGREIRLKLFPSKKMDFWDYLRTPYIPAQINRLYLDQEYLYQRVQSVIASEHKSELICNFYQAIFLATPPSKKLREGISRLGISHLVALSGLHLAILWGVLFGVLRWIYRVFQARYFPYRFDLRDVGFVVLILLGGYVYGVGMPPSLLRSYMMMLLGWGVLMMGIELLSFEFLMVTLMVLLLLFPSLLFSLGFWFSFLGVFYIFLLLRYFDGLSKGWMMVLISFGLFILMMPLVHLIFGRVTLLQLLSPWLSMVFTPFYPLSLGLHLMGLGGIVDEVLLKLFSLEAREYMVVIPWGWGVGYLMLSIGAIYSRWLFYLLLGVALLTVVGMFIPLMLS